MTHQLKKSFAFTKYMHPFVCHLAPLVCSRSAPALPNVGKNMPYVCFQQNNGFSVIEIIVVLTIASVLMALAAPGLQKLVASNRLTAQINDLLADISLARSEAIKRNTGAGLCTSASGAACVSGGNWANGWLVYYVDGGTNKVIKVHEALTGGNTLAATQTDTSTTTSTSVDTVSYSKSGAFANQTYTYRFTVCDPKLKETRMIDITVVGQTAITSGTC